MHPTASSAYNVGLSLRLSSRGTRSENGGSNSLTRGVCAGITVALRNCCIGLALSLSRDLHGRAMGPKGHQIQMWPGRYVNGEGGMMNSKNIADRAFVAHVVQLTKRRVDASQLMGQVLAEVRS
jgi:hypothetical protein